MHEQTTLLIVELMAHGRQLLLPIACPIHPQTSLSRFEENHMPAGFITIDGKRYADNRWEHEQSRPIGHAVKLTREHVMASFT
jgi:hypothetical protein